MSLLRLLSTGKSLVGLRDHERSYQVNDDALLPRFESKKNPFRATTLPANAETQDGDGVVHSADSGKATPKGTHDTESAAATPVFSGQVPAASTPSPGKVRAGVWRAWQVVIGIADFVRRLPRRWFHREREAAPLRGPAQTELRLDCVTVVRNDLSDTDIEVVPRNASLKEPSAKDAKSEMKVPGLKSARPEPEMPEQQPAAESVPSAEAAWSHVSERVFGSEEVK